LVPADAIETRVTGGGPGAAAKYPGICELLHTPLCAPMLRSGRQKTPGISHDLRRL
jgi:hypothetical protein